MKNVKAGDRVILDFRPNCGWCAYCVRGQPVLCNGSETPRNEMFSGGSRLSRNGEVVHHFARTSCFSRYAVMQESGATDVVNASNHDPVERVLELTGGGADYAFEALGRSDIIRRA